MSYFHVIPNALRIQQDELEAACRGLCRDVEEISGVIRRLEAMSGFGSPIAALRQVRQKGSEQQAALRQNIRLLGSVVDIYTRTELKNLDGGGPAVLRTDFAFAEEYSSIAWRPREMLPDAESLFGMQVIIRRKD